jgi:hypothetical protein
MAARHNTNDEDPAAAASDALSLHTIADQADTYAAQEQEDADFALALALEHEENQRLVQTESEVQDQAEVQHNNQTETLPQYRDDPNDEDQNENGPTTPPPPYRDDPNAILEDGIDADENEIVNAPPRRRNCTRILRKVGKAWFWCFGLVTGLTLVIIGIVIILVWMFRKEDPKDAAWKSSGSVDYQLQLPRLYPALEDGTTEECKKLWEQYASGIGCHRMILTSAWDDGKAQEVIAAGANPYGYSVEICNERCRKELVNFAQRMDSACQRRTDRFDLGSYGNDGRAYFGKSKLEEGPMHVGRSLKDRFDRLCARPLRRETRPSEWGTCAADLWMRWGIVDGKNEMNMNGLDTFLEKTKVKKTFPGEWKSGSVAIIGGEKWYNVELPSWSVGPGLGETDCGYCTVDWLERKMRSFEYGEMLDPLSGEALGLGEFNERMTNALQRCKRGANRGGEALQRVRWKWMKYGWWCDNVPCQKDRNVTDLTRQVLHGVRKDDDWPLPWIQSSMAAHDAPTKALEALRHGLTNMPCSIWFNANDAIDQIIPHQHVMERLCSDQCRNAVDRIQQQHGQEFPRGDRRSVPGRLFGAWDMAREQADLICSDQSSKMFCAPGYAALGYPEWVFPQKIPSRPEILSVFSEAIDKLNEKLPRYVSRPKEDAESQKVLARVVAESLCNTCAGEIFIGKNPRWKKTVDEYLDDKSVDGREYVRVAKKGWEVCARLFGHDLTWRERKALWDTTGLDRYD